MPDPLAVLAQDYLALIRTCDEPVDTPRSFVPVPEEKRPPGRDVDDLRRRLALLEGELIALGDRIARLEKAIP
jgi:hypothetical protein